MITHEYWESLSLSIAPSIVRWQKSEFLRQSCLQGAGSLMQAIPVVASSSETSVILTALTKDSTVLSVGAELIDQIPHVHVNNRCVRYSWLMFFFSLFF